MLTEALESRGMPQEREEDETLLLWFDDGHRQIECVGAKVRSGAGQGRQAPQQRFP
jgi:hypothetical protein